MAERDVGNLRTRLSWEDDGAANSLAGFKRDLKGLRSEMNAARSGGKEYTNSLKGLRQQSDILTRRFKTQEQQVKELRKRYEESRRVKGEDAKQTKNLSDQYNNARAAMNRTENQLKGVTSEIERQINPWKRLSGNMTDAGDKMQNFGKGMSDFGRNYSMKVTAPIVTGGIAVFKAASDYESAFAGVEKTVDGTAEQMQGLRQSIRDMAKEIPSSTTEIAKVAEAAGQLGIKTESIEEFTKTMINLGEATNMSSDQAATDFA
ncbi:phage tail tape measure protein, partial [Halomonas sp. MG34]|nr:phage tail tape measure protein [Halomonas sp. MG34]